MTKYRITIEPNGSGGYIASFPAVPEALTEGDTQAEALANASDALEVALLGRMVDGDPLPPSDYRSGPLVAVSAQAAAKLAFYQAFRDAGITRVALAQRLGKAENEVRRMLDPYHATRLPALEAGLKALGRRLTVTAEELVDA